MKIVWYKSSSDEYEDNSNKNIHVSFEEAVKDKKPKK